MPGITQTQLSKLLPSNRNVTPWLEPLNAALQRFEINTPARMAAFLAQLAYESAEFKRLKENLNYSAARLMQVWPKRFTTLKKAKQYERNPEKLANYVYANRMGNGDAMSGDGWRFHGRGLIQLTGRGNYATTGSPIGLPLEQSPELLEQPEGAALSAGYFWKSRGLNELADDRNDDNDDEDFVSITLAINGGRAGLSERQRLWELAKTIV